MASIQALAPNVAEELRASLVINSLEQCATELVQNSIDANASMVEVKVDVAGHSLQVSDNGDGITLFNMERIGGKYTTSKCSTLQDLGCIKTYGFRGEAISAMTEMSLVDIVSYPRDQSFVYSAIFKGGERVYFGRSSKHPRFSHGTTVSVRDLFYKFPVRQRYWSEATVSKLDHVLENVKRAVESLAIITPRVSFTVIDMAKDSKLMSYRKAESLLNRVTSVFGQSMSSSLTFVKSYDDDSYSFTGYISTVGHYNRLFQYIFLNNRPISDERLNRAILQLFQQSSFSKDSVNYEDLKRSRERHPVYVLTLKCSPKLYDICVDPTKMTVGFKDQITTRKRKSRTKLPIGDTSRDMSLDHTSHVKSSRPLKTAKTVRKSTALKWDKTYNDVIDIEDDIEFELDEDWIASTLDV
ncbi:DNA mismatch repair protein [Entomortierella beljakovae]|nr:DNA mismatch repair protein [Entomortierella beljakovae]